MTIKSIKSLKIGLAVIVTVCFFACRKDNTAEKKSPEPVTAGVYILNEGGFTNSNASLSYLSYETGFVNSDIYASANEGAELGDTGQDIKIYGSKTYIVVHGSHRVVVLNTQTAKLIKLVAVAPEGAAPAFPRYMAFARGKVFISAYDDKVYVLDTASLAVEKMIPVGKDPEGMAVVGNKLYVANSGGLSGFDNTLSVIDVNSLTELKKITVAINCNAIVADNYGDLYVTSRGNYADIKPELYRISTSTEQVSPLTIPATAIAIKDDIAYIYKANYNTNTQSYDIGYLTLNVKDETPGRSFITDGTDADIVIPYGLGVDPVSGDIFVADAGDFQTAGKVLVYGKDGKKKRSFGAGVSPSGFAFNTR